MTITPPEPAMVCFTLTASNSMATSSSSGLRMGAEEPPGITAFTLRPAGRPRPYLSSKMSWLKVASSGTSYTPGRFTVPERHTRRVPPDLSVPRPAYQAGPRVKMWGTLASVSTLFTTVGLPNRPTTAGNGGLSRGQPFLPSRLSSSAVSSPQM